MDKILNCIKIDDFISTAGQPSPEQFELIAKEGFEVVINLALCESDNALENEDKIVTSYGISYVHLPVSWEKPQRKKLEEFFLILQALRGKKVFVHCAKNYRVSVFMYLYKKCILNQADAILIAPNEFLPNEIWQEFIKTTQEEM